MKNEYYEDQKLQRAVRRFVNQNVDMIPGVLFERLADLSGDQDSVLQLVGDATRICPNCGHSVERGAELEDGDGFAWSCDNCDVTSDSEDMPYDSLPFEGPTYGGWPAAHGTVFWIDWQRMADLAPDCGFLVYESPDFNGWILAIDGGGYDFYEAHWWKLYHALDLKWHEQDE